MKCQKTGKNIDITKQRFAEITREALKEAVGEDAEISIQNIRKNNGIVLTGLHIFKRDRDISPTIYLESSYEQYLGGESMEEIVRELYDCYLENCPENAFDTDFFMDYGKVKERISYRLINREKNAALLEEIPFIPYLDLAVTFFCKIEHEELGTGIIQVRNEHLKLWRVEKEQIFLDAERNMRRLYPEFVCTMQELLSSAGAEGTEEIPEEMLKEISEAEKLPMMVMTNSVKSYGAAVVLYEGILAGLSKRMQSSLAILPSSVHEMIVLPVKNEAEASALGGMVREINATQVEPEEVLSDSVYFYEKQTQTLTVAS